MTIRPILRFPDSRLHERATEIASFDDALQTLAGDLTETMRAAPGIGITAPHIGVFQRLAVIELTPDDGVQIYANPRIVWASSEMSRHMEGSVCMPGVADEIERPARIRVEFQDLNGTAQVQEADGLLATCIQHEIDQLDGIFWLQKLSRLKRDRVIRRYDKQLRLS